MKLDDMEVTDRHIDAAERLLWDVGERRMDVNETIHFARSLEFVKAQTYDISFGKLKSLQFIPLDQSAPEGAETITYEQWTEVEAATVVANMADDLPSVDAFAAQFTSPVKSLGSSYTWSIQDIKRAAMTGAGIDLRRARAARMSIDRRIDRIGALGIPEANTTGLLNNTAVPTFVFPNAGAWDAITTDLVLENLNALAQAIVDTTLEIEEPNALLCPTAEFGIISSTPMLLGASTDTILQVFLRNQPYITQVDQWARLTGAGGGGSNRFLAYDRSDRVLQYNIPLLFEQLPPQARNLAFKVPVHSRVGVVEIHYPLAMSYADRL